MFKYVAKLDADLLIRHEYGRSFMCSTFLPQCLPSYIKAAVQVLNIFTMAGYFPDIPLISKNSFIHFKLCSPINC